MAAHGERATCAGAQADSGKCAAPLACTVERWCACRSERIACARHAVSVLAHRHASERARPSAEESVAVCVTSAVLGLPATRLKQFPPDRLFDTLVSDLVWDALSGRGRPGEDRSPPAPEGWTWPALLDAFQREAARWLRTHGVRGTFADDLSREALCRVIEARSRELEIRSPLAWVRRVFQSLARDASRGKADGPLPPRIESLALAAGELARHRETPSPEETLLRQDLFEWAPPLLDRLPPPYREIAHLQYRLHWTRRQIAAWLAAWRQIGTEGARMALRLTHQMLRAFGNQQEPRRLWPGRYDPRRNPWFSSTPPPPFSPLPTDRSFEKRGIGPLPIAARDGEET